MNDKILEMFFDTERWRYAIEKGVGKHINKAHLYQLTKPDTRAAMYAKIRFSSLNRVSIRDCVDTIKNISSNETSLTLYWRCLVK